MKLSDLKVGQIWRAADEGCTWTITDIDPKGRVVTTFTDDDGREEVCDWNVWRHDRFNWQLMNPAEFALGDIICLKRDPEIQWRVEYVHETGERYTLRRVAGKAIELARGNASACRFLRSDLEWLKAERPTETDERDHLILVHLPRG